METFNKNNIVFGRTPMVHDHRDFQMARFITPAMERRAAQISVMDWPIDLSSPLDQGATPRCVGYAWANHGKHKPVPQPKWTNATGDDIYKKAKVIDGDNQDGSTTRSGVQAFVQEHNEPDSVGSVGAYAFAATIDEIITWLLTKGPVVTGTNWYDYMFTPNSKGVVSVGGSLAGGHEWVLCGVDVTNQMFHATNSWGGGWGIDSQFYISIPDYKILFDRQGDACVVEELTTDPVPVPVPTPTPTPGGCSQYIPGLNAVIKQLQGSQKQLKNITKNMR